MKVKKIAIERKIIKSDKKKKLNRGDIIKTI